MASMGALKVATLLLLICALLSPAITAVRAEDAVSEEDLLAEEAAAAAVGQQAEEEEDEDGGDAMDEDADSARLHPDRHPLTALPPPARDVSIAAKFVDGLGEDRTLTLGRDVSVLVALANGGRSNYHVWGIMGSLNMDTRFNMYVQNFSYSEVNQTVPAGSEVSMSYSFTPNERLDTRKFQLALSVFYEAQSADGSALRGHSNTFFNETVGTVAGPQSINNTAFMTLAILFLLACAGLLAFFLTPTAEPNKRAAAQEKGTSQGKASDWLEEHSRTMQSGGGRSAPSKVSKRR